MYILRLKYYKMLNLGLFTDIYNLSYFKHILAFWWGCQAEIQIIFIFTSLPSQIT